ncbi:SGNH/GDSL hydrolase family protein [Paraburkholderia sp. BR10872]|uniref:SGNH/GDSL hydrolase family protein n=1 Tax=Paraburkholderia sp. BR10872 TaxID=3236989 RepID=UPI0034D2072C
MPASTPIVQLAVFGDDQAMGIGYTSMGMAQPITPNAPAALQALLQKQLSDTGIQVSDLATGGRASSLANLLDGMDGGGAPFAQRLTANPASIVVISYAINDQYGGETPSDFGGYLTQAIQTAQSAGRTVVLEEPSPTCDTDHPRLADYSSAIDAAGKALGVPVIQQFAFVSSIQGWQAHMDASCTVPDAYIDAIKAQQELAVIAPLVRNLIKG